MNRRAYSIETSYLAERDDPFLPYYKALALAAKTKSNEDPCFIHATSTEPEEKPTSNNAAPPAPVDKKGTEMQDVPEKEAKPLDERAESCRKFVDKSKRWNTTRFWFSYSSGDYEPETGGERHSLGKTLVLGGSYGLELSNINTGWTLAYTRVKGAPTLESMILPSPVRQDHNLVFAQLAFGGEKIRGIVQGTNVKDKTLTSATRVYKRALGLDMLVREGTWIQIRTGKQRKLDNSGDENTSSFSLNFSPDSSIKL